MNSLAAMARGTVVIGGGEEEYQQKQQLDVLERIITAINNKELSMFRHYFLFCMPFPLK